MKTNKVNACESIRLFVRLFLSLRVLFPSLFLLLLFDSSQSDQLRVCISFSLNFISCILQKWNAKKWVLVVPLHVYCHRETTMLLFLLVVRFCLYSSIILYLENNYFVRILCVDASAGICLFGNRAQLYLMRSVFQPLSQAYM